MSPALDLGVTIERVRVRTRAAAEPHGPRAVMSGGLDGAAGARQHDHRIVVRELRIDVEAELDDLSARRLGEQVAWDLAGRLGELQAHRQAGIARNTHAAGAVHVELLRVHLWGSSTDQPAVAEISARLLAALEEGVRDAR